MSRYLTGNSRTDERLSQQREQQRAARRFENPVRSELEKAMNQIIRHYEREGTFVGTSGIQADHETRLRRLLRDEWEAAARAGGARVLSEVKRFHGRGWIKKSSAEEVFEQAVSDFIETEAARRIVGIAATTAGQIRKRLRGLEARDMNVDEVAKEVRKAVPMLSAYRAMMIARTESHSAFNAGHKAAADASELELEREWVSAQDERTRENGFDHVAADGEVVREGEDFLRTGQRMRYPGDPNGEPGNVIHCRCGVADIVV